MPDSTPDGTPDDRPDPSEPPVERAERGPLRHAESLVLVNTGDGKGKSTAAFGTALRALARDWPVAVVQFIKSGDWRVGEQELLTRLGADWWALGDGFSWDSEDLDESRALAEAAWRRARDTIEADGHRLVVLDEITYPMNWGWIDLDEVVTCLRDRPAAVSVIVTGRDAAAELIELADTVTEMLNVKHAFDAGITARRGIDY